MDFVDFGPMLGLTSADAMKFYRLTLPLLGLVVMFLTQCALCAALPAPGCLRLGGSRGVPVEPWAVMCLAMLSSCGGLIHLYCIYMDVRIVRGNGLPVFLTLILKNVCAVLLFVLGFTWWNRLKDECT